MAKTQQVKQLVFKRLAIALVLLSCSASGMADAPVTPQDMALLGEVRDLYQDNCAMCHGYDGIPMLPGTPNFFKGERFDKSDEELLESIAKGKDMMPPWEDQLDEAQHQQLLDYVKGIAGEMVFQDKCESCHGDTVPAMSGNIPKNREEIMAHVGDIELCAGDVEATMSREEITEVVVFLRSLHH